MRFSGILNKPISDIVAPPLLPIGHYIAQLKRLPDMGSVKDGLYDTVDFPLSIVSACESVDPDELAAFGNPAGQIVRRRFMFNTDPAEERSFRLSEVSMKNFLALTGNVTEPCDVATAINDAIGGFVKVEIEHRADPKNPANRYLDVGRTAVAD